MAESTYRKYVKEFEHRNTPHNPLLKFGPPLGMDEHYMEGCKQMFDAFYITEPTALNLLRKDIFPGAVQMGEHLTDDSPMYHLHDEYYIFLGTNPDDDMDLGGEIEMWLGLGDRAEKFMITKPSFVMVPAGIVHTPLIFHRVDRLIIWVVVAPIAHIVSHHVPVLPTTFEKPTAFKV